MHDLAFAQAPLLLQPALVLGDANDPLKSPENTPVDGLIES